MKPGHFTLAEMGSEHLSIKKAYHDGSNVENFKQRDCTVDARDLLARFVNRHALHYDDLTDGSVELMCEFPVQRKLSTPITVGLQNFDELNFGVADFWSHIFPFSAAEQYFENILNSWVTGQARIIHGGRWRPRVLELWNGAAWESAYTIHSLGLRNRPLPTIQNDPHQDPELDDPPVQDR